MAESLPAEPQFSLEITRSLRDVAAADWNACIPGGSGEHPFLDHAFLEALESSGSATARTGWAGAHLLLRDVDGQLVAVAPCYLKSHSRGEYVFDWGWAEAFERAGGQYYPKLQVSVPFTPVTGPRMLVKAGATDAETEARRIALARGFSLLMEKAAASSVHLTFLSQSEAEFLGKLGFLLRRDQQFHWRNDGYANYDAFLAALASRKRKAIKRERREVRAHGVTIRWLTGSDLTEAIWDDFFAFYMDTGSRKWGRPYLTRKFFSLIGARMADRILLVVAERGGRRIAGALNFIGQSTLYGRNWGALEHIPFLHFELCYHQAIEFAIARGLKVVEAGAQGEHKLARGYMPVSTHSAHLIADSGLRKAISAFLRRERIEVETIMEEYQRLGPFKHLSPLDPREGRG